MSGQDMLAAIAIVSVLLAATTCAVAVVAANARVQVAKAQQPLCVGTIKDDEGKDDAYLDADPNLLALLHESRLRRESGMWSSGTIEYGTKHADVAGDDAATGTGTAT